MSIKPVGSASLDKAQSPLKGDASGKAKDSKLKLAPEQEILIQEKLVQFYTACKDSYLKPEDNDVLETAREKLDELQATYRQFDIDSDTSFKDFLKRLEQYAVSTDGDLGRSVFEECRSRFASEENQPAQEPSVQVLQELQAILSQLLGPGVNVKVLDLGPRISREKEEQIDMAVRSYASAVQKYFEDSTDAQNLSTLSEARAILAKTYRESGVFSGPEDAFDNVGERLDQIILYPRGDKEAIRSFTKELTSLFDALCTA